MLFTLVLCHSSCCMSHKHHYFWWWKYRTTSTVQYCMQGCEQAKQSRRRRRGCEPVRLDAVTLAWMWSIWECVLLEHLDLKYAIQVWISLPQRAGIWASGGVCKNGVNSVQRKVCVILCFMSIDMKMCKRRRGGMGGGTAAAPTFPWNIRHSRACANVQPTIFRSFYLAYPWLSIHYCVINIL
jgi:hypothetical protein